MGNITKKGNIYKTIWILLLSILLLLVLTFFCALPKIYSNINEKTGALVAMEEYSGVDYSTDKTKVYLKGNLMPADVDSLIAKVKDIFAVSQVEYSTKVVEQLPKFSPVKFLLSKNADVIALEGSLASAELVDLASKKLEGFKLSNKLATDKNLPLWWSKEALEYLISLPLSFSNIKITITHEELSNTNNSLTLTGKLSSNNEELKDQIEEQLTTIFGKQLALAIDISLPEVKKVLYNLGECTNKINAHLSNNPILFERAKSDLSVSDTANLDKVAKIMKNCDANIKFEVSGHADSRGNDSINKPLSNNRARVALDYLVELGIDSKRLVSKGYSSYEPVATNASVAGRKLNRRVEIKPETK